MINLRIGNGFDAHKLVKGRKCILGGVTIDYEYGLEGHSDADVLTHAIIDSLLGASGLGDIGRHFPDTDNRFKDISSIELLKRTNNLLIKHSINIVNIDATVICEQPKISPYIKQIKTNISEVLDVDVSRINIKGTTTEKLGFTGRGEGIAAMAASLVAL